MRIWEVSGTYRRKENDLILDDSFKWSKTVHTGNKGDYQKAAEEAVKRLYKDKVYSEMIETEPDADGETYMEKVQYDIHSFDIDLIREIVTTDN
jgi:hypothetical protein